MNSISKQQIRRENLKGRFCPCGKPATAFECNGFVCSNCSRIEHEIYDKTGEYVNGLRSNPNAKYYAVYHTRFSK